MGPMRRRKVEVIAIIGDICPAEAAAERSVFEGCDVARAARRAFNDVNAGDAENIKSIDDILVLRLGTATGNTICRSFSKTAKMIIFIKFLNL